MQTAGVLLVAVESGAALPSWIGHCQDKVSDVVLLVGSSEEPTHVFLKRVDQRLSLLAESEYQRGLVVLVAQPSVATAEAEDARMQIADHLLGYLAELGEGTLLVLSEESASLESRVQLLSMAGNLAQQVRGTKLSISVRFGTQTGSEPPHEISALSQPISRRTSRRPPPKSGQMLKPELAPLHKVPSMLPKRRFSSAG